MVVRPAAAILDEFEQSCIDAQEALRERDWAAATNIWIRQRTMTHELEQALESVPRPSEERRLLDARVDRIMTYRDKQLHSLESFRESIGAKLTTMDKFKRYSRVYGEQQPAPRLLDKTQ